MKGENNEAYFSLQKTVFLPQDGGIINFHLQLGEMNFTKDRDSPHHNGYQVISLKYTAQTHRGIWREE